MLNLHGVPIESEFPQLTVVSKVVARFAGKASVIAGRGVDYPD